MTTAGKPEQIKSSSHRAAVLMEMALKKTGVGFIHQSTDLKVMLFANLPVRLHQAGTLFPENGDLFGGDNDVRLTELKRAVLQDQQSVTTEVEIQSSSGLVTYRIEIEPVLPADGGGLLTVITDISDTLHRERILKTLLRELSHRSKNLLAIIQGIATQTARQALSLDGFLTTFRGRIQSLSYSQDLVTDSSWRGAYLFELAERQFNSYWPNTANPIAVTGINAHLSPNATLHIGLALHELIVNSASHGAISAGVNSLTVNCFETIFNEQKAIELAWIEHLPASITTSKADEHTFARTVLERVVPIAIGGKARYTTTGDRIEYHLTVPVREYEIITRIEE
ncbi:sensor histidine kinase [Rhizobium sp. 32-5/1]|uniref:sensor histidine kinase n=1 Tax=Rhizobium sp. 32-5/1 TaxID=3019602 RepID=UPI00240E8E26|nr:sensor histidine kinase [Rhizobium sp. 32-5/1]WEZ82817.1 sensor histidine kinase [Rhizobium sp. 32-5/1]